VTVLSSRKIGRPQLENGTIIYEPGLNKLDGIISLPFFIGVDATKYEKVPDANNIYVYARKDNELYSGTFDENDPGSYEFMLDWITTTPQGFVEGLTEVYSVQDFSGENGGFSNGR
jgi:hypothetical protein